MRKVKSEKIYLWALIIGALILFFKKVKEGKMDCPLIPRPIVKATSTDSDVIDVSVSSDLEEPIYTPLGNPIESDYTFNHIPRNVEYEGSSIEYDNPILRSTNKVFEHNIIEQAIYNVDDCQNC